MLTPIAFDKLLGGRVRGVARTNPTAQLLFELVNGFIPGNLSQNRSRSHRRIPGVGLVLADNLQGYIALQLSH